MSQKFLETTLHPDGRVSLPCEDLPKYPVRIIISFIDEHEEPSLTEPGDYLVHLMDYEDRLARGEIQWQ